MLMEPSERADFYDALFAYVFEGIEPQLDGKMQQVAWLLVRPNVENSMKKQENGSKGGRPKAVENRDDEAKPNGKPTSKPTGKPNGKPTDKPSGKPTGKTTAKTDKDKEKDRDMDKEGKFSLPREEVKTSPADSVAASARAAPQSAKCPSCGTVMGATNSHKGDRRLFICPSCFEEVYL